jgi:diaminopimelate epimerase
MISICSIKKYHGLGNDYIIIDPNITSIDLKPELIRKICDRHFGIGSDGILYGPINDCEPFELKIFNPDGSEAEKSGNGLRIFAKYLYDFGYTSAGTFNIKTIAGIVQAQIMDDNACQIKIDMGKVTFDSKLIPVAGPRRQVINEPLNIAGKTYNITCLSIGNPHCVIPCEDVTQQKALKLGQLIENHELFPNRINMQLLKVIDRSTIRIQIWERGAGYTLASGSSSCAAAAAANKLGLVDSTINVKMPGGQLLVQILPNGHVDLLGPVEYIFDASIDTKTL